MCFLPLSKNNLDQWWRVSKKILKYMDIMLYTFESNKSCEELKVNQSQIKITHLYLWDVVKPQLRWRLTISTFYTRKEESIVAI